MDKLKPITIVPNRAAIIDVKLNLDHYLIRDAIMYFCVKDKYNNMVMKKSAPCSDGKFILYAEDTEMLLPNQRYWYDITIAYNGEYYPQCLLTELNTVRGAYE